MAAARSTNMKSASCGSRSATTSKLRSFPMSRRRLVRLLPLAALTMPAGLEATVYLTVEQAQSAMFPRQALTPAFRQLQPAQIAAIKKLSGAAPLSKDLRAWRAQDGGWFIVDRVIGKHELIT